MLIQVLDDSDDVATQALIKEEVEKWKENGTRIVYRHRVLRDGYKAGNLKSAMNCSYVKDYEFVVIFDADFQPTPDFLKRTVPHFKVCCPVFVVCFLVLRVLVLTLLENLVCRARMMLGWCRRGGHLLTKTRTCSLGCRTSTSAFILRLSSR